MKPVHTKTASPAVAAFARRPRPGRSSVQTEIAAPAAPALARLPRGRSSESGYVYFMVLCLMVMMATASTAVLMDMRTQRRRQREDDMIWRGREFVRAIKLYYRKTGHYPQNIDDLQKGVVNVHFLRQEALTDPMNKDGDGKWRFIYTNPTGQIIGSVHYATMQQMAILDMYGGKIPGTKEGESDAPFGADINPGVSSESDQNQPAQGTSTSNTNCSPASVSAPGLASSLPGLQTGAGLGANPMGVGQIQSQPTQIGTGSSFSLSSSSPSPSGQNQSASGTCSGNPLAGMQLAALQALMNLKPTGPVDSPVVGGFVVGVGSTVDRKSVRIYRSGKKYNEWEFIWNPVEDQALAVAQGLGQGAGAAGGISGTGPLGQPTGFGGQGFGTTGGAGPVQAPPTEGPPQPQRPQDQ